MRPTLIEATTPSHALPAMLKQLLENDHAVDSRNGVTLEVPNAVVHVMTSTAPYITTPGRKASLPAQIAETMWVLAGRNDVEFLQHYLPRAAEFSDDGKVWRGGYGPRLRSWGEGTVLEDTPAEPVDQLAHVVKLLRADLETRRAVMAIYDPLTDTEPGKDIPCNNWLHFLYRDGKLHLHVATRSNDVMWGWSGINSFEWSVLLQVVAGLVGVEPGSITYSVTSLHLYDRHVAKARRIVNGYENLLPTGRPGPMTPAPALELGGWYRYLGGFNSLVDEWFILENAIRTGRSGALDRIKDFPEPMLRSWLYVLQAWWSGDDHRLAAEYGGTDLSAAYAASPINPRVLAQREEAKAAAARTVALTPKGLQHAEQLATGRPKPEWMPFTDYVIELHAAKDAAYGDSWKRRGEQMAIMANIARKVDRLGANGGGDTAADTAIDLLVYLVKYRLWLVDKVGAPVPGAVTDDQDHDLSHGTKYVEQYLRGLGKTVEGLQDSWAPTADLERQLRDRFDNSLTAGVESGNEDRYVVVNAMISMAHTLAMRLYKQLGDSTRPFNGYATTDEEG